MRTARDQADLSVESILVREALQKLPRDEAAIVVLQEYGFSYREIMDILDVDYGEVEDGSKNARRKLRELLAFLRVDERGERSK